MTKPTVDQKEVLREQLRQMEPDQWLAMVRWFSFKLVEDQELTIQVISDETERRRRRHAENHVGSELKLSAAVSSVLTDLGFSIGEHRK